MAEVPERPPITHKTLTWRASMAALHVLYTIVWPTRVVGRERVPRSGRLVLVANHQSFLDIPLLAKGVLRRHVAFVARDSLARSRFLAFIMRHCGAILIGRGRADRAALRAMVAHLKAEDAIAIFPEGTRTPDGRLQVPKKGALVAARMAGAPILPCAIRGSHGAWPRGARFPHPHRLEVEFGAPIDSARPDALEATWAAIAEMLGEPLPGGESPPGSKTADTNTDATGSAHAAGPDESTSDEPVSHNP